MHTLFARCGTTADQLNGQSIVEIVEGVASLDRTSEARVHDLFIYLYIIKSDLLISYIYNDK